jgi:CheY-like chemotaxis protein
MNGLELIRTLAQRDSLPIPLITVAARGVLKDREGRRLRGAYNAMTHQIILTDPNDLENAEHEYLHYRDHMRHGNPLATFICQDAACNYHMPTV